MIDPQRYQEPLGAAAAWAAWRRVCAAWAWPVLRLALVALVIVGGCAYTCSGAWMCMPGQDMNLGGGR